MIKSKVSQMRNLSTECNTESGEKRIEYSWEDIAM